MVNYDLAIANENTKGQTVNKPTDARTTDGTCNIVVMLIAMVVYL